MYHIPWSTDAYSGILKVSVTNQRMDSLESARAAYAFKQNMYIVHGTNAGRALSLYTCTWCDFKHVKIKRQHTNDGCVDASCPFICILASSWAARQLREKGKNEMRRQPKK